MPSGHPAERLATETLLSHSQCITADPMIVRTESRIGRFGLWAPNRILAEGT